MACVGGASSPNNTVTMTQCLAHSMTRLNLHSRGCQVSRPFTGTQLRSASQHTAEAPCSLRAPLQVDAKMKTRKAAAKRFKVDKDGTILRRHAGKQHMNEKKTKKRKKFLGTDSPMHETNINNNMGCLPYAKINIPRSKFSPGPQGRQPPNKTLQQASESSSEASSSEASS